MKSIQTHSRRDFLKGMIGGGGLLATSLLPVFGHEKFERLNIVRIHMPIGATRPFSVLHFSDTHLTLAYDHEGKNNQKRKINRSKTFGGRQEESLRDTLAWAKDNTDYVLHTGDLMDWVSEANLDAAKKYIGNYPAFFGALGNHEISWYLWKKMGEAGQNEKIPDAQKLQEVFSFNILFDSKVVNGINFVSIAHVYDNVLPIQITKFKEEVKKGLPIVLLMHVPFFSPEILAVMEQFWRCGSKFRNIPFTPIKYNKITRDFMDYLRKEPMLRGILAGHLHITVQGRFSPTAVQYVVGGNYGFVAQEICFC